MKTHFCDCCGQQLTKEDTHQISISERYTRHTEKILDLCATCAARVRHNRYPVTKLRRKAPTMYNVVERSYMDGKVHQETLYAIMATQLKTLFEFKTPEDKLLRVGLDGKHFWTVSEVRRCLESDDKFLLDMCSKVCAYQAPREIAERRTIYANAVGFNHPDASFLTGMSALYKDKGLKAFTVHQLEATRKLLTKYSKQITAILNR